MIRILYIITFLFLELSAQNYELQLFASKDSNSKGLTKSLDAGVDAGLMCYITTENRVDGEYSFVRCDETSEFNEIQNSIKKAKHARLNFYLLKPKNVKTVEQNYDTFKITKTFSTPDTVIENYSQDFFGNNPELLKILHNKNGISKQELLNQKELYLRSIQENEKFNGLYLKGSGYNYMGINKSDFSVRLQWNIFGDGYYESKKRAMKVLLQKDSDYERILDEYRALNLEISLFKMHSVSNYIDYYFLKKEEIVLSNLYKRAKKQYDASVITSDKFFKYKNNYENVRAKLLYFEGIDKEKYDAHLQTLVSHIENINLVDKMALCEEAYSNSYEIKNTQNKIALSSIEDSWIDKLRTNIYVEEKKAVYLENPQTVAGFSLQVPLDFYKKRNNIHKDIEAKTQMLKAQSLAQIITRNIGDLYNKINYYKSSIKNLKNNIELSKSEISQLDIKEKYPLANKNAGDTILKKEMLKLSIIKHNKEIWQNRTHILKLLLKLQNLSGVKIVPNYP